MLLTTGNKSEMAVGYATLYGDMAGGFAPIKDCSKMMVYRLAALPQRARAGPAIPQRVIDRPPSAELRPDQKDSDSLPPSTRCSTRSSRPSSRRTSRSARSSRAASTARRSAACSTS